MRDRVEVKLFRYGQRQKSLKKTKTKVFQWNKGNRENYYYYY